MDDKKKFLQKLFGMFNCYGAKSLTMDDIAKEFSISKKTLYQKYKNKDDLLHGVLEYISQDAISKVDEVIKQYNCPIEILLVSGSRIDEVTCQEHNAFVLQLIKYYPDVFHQHQKNISGKITEILKNNYSEGVALEYFRKDINIELYIKFLITLLFSTDISPLFEEVENKKSISIGMKVFYLDAIVTEKGKQRLKELKNNYEELG